MVSPPVEPYPAAVLADHPVSYWRLNETPDNGSGNNGLVANDYRGGSSSVYSNSIVAQVAAHYVAAGIPPRFSQAPPGSVAVDEHGTLILCLGW